MSFIPKLRLQADRPVYLLSAPDNLDRHFDEYTVCTVLPRTATVQQALFFALNSKDMNSFIPKLIKKLQPDAKLWIAYPKKSGNIKSDLIRDEGWDAVYNAGYEPVTAVSINDDWTGMRFRKSEEIKDKLRATPMEERKTEGIDYMARTVTLPGDALEAMSGYDGMADFFQNMAFTHKKEHMEAIADAKKPETRARRIGKMVEMLHIQMQTKRNKTNK